MTITLELGPEIEARLAVQARAHGLSLEDYLKKVVELQATRTLAIASTPPLRQDEWEGEFQAFIDSFPQQPVLPDRAISRESIYTREDEL